MWHTACVVDTLKAYMVDKIIDNFFNKYLKIPR